MNGNFLDIPHAINGDTVIGFTSTKGMKSAGWFDSSRVATYLSDPSGDQFHTKYLGLIKLMASTHMQSTPFLTDLFSDNAVLEVEEGQSVTYDMPVSPTSAMCIVKVDTSNDLEFPGYDGTVFPLILSHEYTAGDVLTYDAAFGVQVMVSAEHPVEQHGDAYKHYVVISSNEKAEYFPKEWLQVGREYFKIDHIVGEWETQFSQINMMGDSNGIITNEFLLGDARGVEAFMTAKAANMSAPGMAMLTENARKSMEQNMAMLGKNNEMFFTAKVAYKGGKPAGIVKGSENIGFTMEYLALAELFKLEANSITFSKGGTFRTAHGMKSRNEGIWQSMRRGKIIKYAREGGILRDHLMQAAAYIYKNSTMPIEQRRVKFRAGTMAYQNVMDLIRREAIAQVEHLPSKLLGTDAQIKPVFSGELNDLKMAVIMISGAFFPGIGYVEVELDPSLDFRGMADRRSRGFFGAQGFADTSYSLVIWDATLPEYTNVRDKVKGADLVEDGKENANIYYVKPKGGSVVYGYEQGRMAEDSKMERVSSSLKLMGKNIWAVSRGEALMLDTTKHVIIELQRVGER